MSSLSKEEDLIIRQMLSGKTVDTDLLIIRKCALDVKEEKGVYSEVVKFGADLHSARAKIAEITGLSMPMSGALSRVLWGLVRQKFERARQLGLGITHGIWVYENYLCKHPSHSQLNGKSISLKKGIRIGFFKRIHAGQLVGCGCIVKPKILP